MLDLFNWLIGAFSNIKINRIANRKNKKNPPDQTTKWIINKWQYSIYIIKNVLINLEIQGVSNIKILENNIRYSKNNNIWNRQEFKEWNIRHYSILILNWIF